MKTLKYSRQREAIKSFLQTRLDHPTADTVYQNLREMDPNISLGTVYRNLNLLSDIGEIQKFTCGDGKEHFDWNADPHYHFVCRSCGAVEDIHMELMKDVELQAQKNTAARIEGHSILFKGLCGSCTDQRAH